MREKNGLTQRKLAHDLGISQNYIPAIEANSRQAGPKLQQQMVKYFGCAFEDLFQVVLVDSETGSERSGIVPSDSYRQAGLRSSPDPLTTSGSWDLSGRIGTKLDSRQAAPRR